jgi:hypothetical protein
VQWADAHSPVGCTLRDAAACSLDVEMPDRNPPMAAVHQALKRLLEEPAARKKQHAGEAR